MEAKRPQKQCDAPSAAAAAAIRPSRQEEANGRGEVGEDTSNSNSSSSSSISKAEEDEEDAATQDTHDQSVDSDDEDDEKKVPATAAAATLAAMSASTTRTVSASGSSATSSNSKSATPKKRKRKAAGISSSERWEKMFQRLKKYKEHHNHCSVPNRYPEDPSLGCWVSTQRRHYKKAAQKPGEGLTPERTARLREIGFEWTGENPRHKNWDIRFAELKEFKAKYGHAQVPIGFEDNVQLANWTSTQRQEYKNLLKGKSSVSSFVKLPIVFVALAGFFWSLLPDQMLAFACFAASE